MMTIIMNYVQHPIELTSDLTPLYFLWTNANSKGQLNHLTSYHSIFLCRNPWNLQIVLMHLTVLTFWFWDNKFFEECNANAAEIFSELIFEFSLIKLAYIVFIYKSKSNPTQNYSSNCETSLKTYFYPSVSTSFRKYLSIQTLVNSFFEPIRPISFYCTAGTSSVINPGSDFRLE